MGLRQSHPVTHSPSAAFGRLRIDSPAARARSLRLKRSGGLTTSERNLLGIAKSERLSVESSPLILRKLESTESITSIPSPPFALWIGPALICALCYALYNIFIKKGSASIHPVLGGVILQFVAASLGSVLLLVLIGKEGKDELNFDQEGISWAIAAGAAVGAAEILSFIVSGMGVQAMQSIPIIIGGSVLFGTTLGFFCLGEELTYRGWIGVACIAAGITLVGTDPGGAGSIH